MITLYNFSIFVFGLLVKAASIFQPKARAFAKGRKDILKNISESVKNNTSPVIWMHCASLGEFEQGRPIIEAIKSEFPDHKIFLTFFSPSGFEIRKNYPQADFVFYLPLDTASNAKKLINAVKPVLAIFVKYEFWHHFTEQLKLRNIPILSVSSKF